MIKKPKNSKKNKNQVIVVPTSKTAYKTKKTKTSSIAYYNCLLTSAQQG